MDTIDFENLSYEQFLSLYVLAMMSHIGIATVLVHEYDRVRNGD